MTLAPAFWEELKNRPIPVDTEVVRAFANNPGCLDLYTLLTWRCFQAKDTQQVPLFGPNGLACQLGVQDYGRERKFRERIREWLELVRLCWAGLSCCGHEERRFPSGGAGDLGGCADLSRWTDYLKGRTTHGVKILHAWAGAVPGR